MFAQRLRCLIPSALPQHIPDILSIYSRLYENLPRSLMQGVIPLRNPHHSTSLSAILGSERELAHGGLLFLDEFPEFRRDLIEALREPLELGWVHISRAAGKISWQADFQLIAASNNCPCGWLGSKAQVCQCTHNKISSYWKKLSGPVLDRIDMHYLMPERAQGKKNHNYKFSSKGQTRKLLNKRDEVRLFQREHRAKLSDYANRFLPQQFLFEASSCNEQEMQNHINYLESLGFSARSFGKILRVARTIADLSFSIKIDDLHLYKAACLHHSMLNKEFGGLN